MNRNRTYRKANSNRATAWLVGLCILVMSVTAQVRWMQKQEEGQAKPIPLRIKEMACYHCAGSGYVRDVTSPHKSVECAVCCGVGKRYIKAPNDVRRLCPSCAGMGREYSGDNQAETCKTCRGWGIVIVTTFKSTIPVSEGFVVSDPAPLPEDGSAPSNHFSPEKTDPSLPID